MLWIGKWVAHDDLAQDNVSLSVPTELVKYILLLFSKKRALCCSSGIQYADICGRWFLIFWMVGTSSHYPRN